MTNITDFSLRCRLSVPHLTEPENPMPRKYMDRSIFYVLPGSNLDYSIC